jgi:hypothetical protein
VDDTRLEPLGQPEPELEAERLGDLLREQRSDSPAVDSPYELAAEPPPRESVIGEL